MITFLKKNIALWVLLGIFIQTNVALAITIPVSAPSSVTNAQNQAAKNITTVQNGVQTVERISGTNLQTVLAAAGLKNQKFRDCTSSAALGQLANTIKNVDSLIKNAVTSYVTDVFTTLKQNLIKCSINAIGGVFGFKPFQCSLSIGDAATGALIKLKDRELQQNFIANCISRLGAQNAANDVNTSFQENGPYGSGPSWVVSWADIKPTAQRRAKARFWNELVNTNICPYMRDQIYVYFEVPQAYIDHPASMAGISVNDGDDFPTRAACTLPLDFIPTNAFNTSTYFGYVGIVSQQQNNFGGFIDMAMTELANQTSAMVDAAESEANSNGGILPQNECATWSPDGSICMVAGPNKQVPGTLGAIYSAARQSEFDSYQKDALDDVETSIANSLFNLADAALPINIEIGPQYDASNLQSLAPTPSPTPIPVPGDGSPADPVCTGGDIRCSCVKNDTDTQSSLSAGIAPAIASVMQNNPTLFSPPGSSTIAPGVNYRTVLQNICAVMNAGGTQVCKPHPSQDDTVVILTGSLSISVNVITPNGTLRTNGGQAIAACELGVQD